MPSAFPLPLPVFYSFRLPFPRLIANSLDDYAPSPIRTAYLAPLFALFNV